MNVTVLIRGHDLPGAEFCDPQGNPIGPVHVGIQKGREVIDHVRADASEVTFQADFRVERKPDGRPNFLGPYAQGKPDDRFFYLSWGVVPESGEFQMFRRLKVRLGHLSWAALEASSRSGDPIEVRIGLTDRRGGPLCATPPPANLKWIVPG